MDPWVGKIRWRREWQPTPVFLPGEFHGQRSLVGYSPWGRKESDTTGVTNTREMSKLNITCDPGLNSESDLAPPPPPQIKDIIRTTDKM